MTAAIENLLKEKRSEILNCLKMSGLLSVGEIATAVGVSKVCVRRHLDLLSRDGLVGYQVRKRERGRPGHHYHLTEKAAMLFPTAYCDFALDLLRQVEELFGASALSNVISGQARNRGRLLKAQIDGLGFDTSVRRLFSIVNQRGFDVTVRKLKDGSYLIRQHNCPTSRVAASYVQLCEEELKTYRELLGVEVERQCRIVAGAQSCDYRVFPPGHRGTLVHLEKSPVNPEIS